MHKYILLFLSSFSATCATEERLIFKNEVDNIQLSGTFTFPEWRNGPYPVVILLPGSGPMTSNDDEPFESLANKFSEHGIAAVRFDKRGTGNSEGEYLSATTHDNERDAKAAVNYLKTRQDVDIHKIGLFGHSEGGLIAAMITSEDYDKNISFLMIYAAPSMNMFKLGKKRKILMFDQYEKQLPDMKNDLNLMRILDKKIIDEIVLNKEIEDKNAFDKAQELCINFYIENGKNQEEAHAYAANTLSSYKTVTSFTWTRGIIELHPLNFFKKIRVPTLLVYGSSDLHVPADLNALATFNAIRENGNQNVSLLIKDRLGHQYFEHDSSDAFAAKKPDDAILAIFPKWLAEFISNGL